MAGLNAIGQGEPFDAVVGRYVLMFNPDPSGVIRALGKLARPGGIIAFHEFDFSGRRSNPPAPMYDRCGDLIVETFKKVGTDPYMGQGLYPAFVRAGLAPLMGLRALIGGPMADLRPVDLISGLGMTMAPVMKAHGLFGSDEIAAPSYQERMREEVTRLGSVVIGRFEIGAWSRLP